MDKTETYRKMSDCPEIQEQSSKSEGNWWIGGDMVFCIGAYREEMVHEGYTWLPTQGRVQEMLRFEADRYGGVQIEPVQLLNRFGVFCEELLRDKNHTEKFQTSIDQLWLAFYMSEKHNKIRDGEKWVKEK